MSKHTNGWDEAMNDLDKADAIMARTEHHNTDRHRNACHQSDECSTCEIRTEPIHEGCKRVRVAHTVNPANAVDLTWQPADGWERVAEQSLLHDKDV